MVGCFVPINIDIGLIIVELSKHDSISTRLAHLSVIISHIDLQSIITLKVNRSSIFKLV